MTLDTFQGWIATLSNGDTAFEGPPVAGEKSSWQKLLDRLDKDNLRITSLRVQRGGVTINALQKKECDGYFQAYESRMTLFQGKPQYAIKQAIGSVVGDKIFVIWIDEANNVYSDVRELQADKIHTTLRNT